MAGGPIAPFSVMPDTSGEVFPNVHVGATGRLFAGMGVIAGGPTAADQVIYYQFLMPPALPAGQMKLVTLLIANATSGDAIFRPEWVSIADDEDADAATVNAETNTTVTWAAGDRDHLWIRKINLDADTPVAGEMIHMDFVLEFTGYDVAAVVTYNSFIIWE